MGRTLPHSREAEAAVLGAVLLSAGEALDRISGIVVPDDCYVPAHQFIFSAALELHRRGHPVDMVTLPEQLGRDLDRAGGYSGLADLASSATTVEAIEHHARIVRDRSQLRQVIQACNEITASAFAEDAPADEVISTASEKLSACYSSDIGGRDVREVVLEVLTRAEQAYRLRRDGREDEILAVGVPTGIAQLDEMLTGGGLPVGQLSVLAADTGRGKSALAANIAFNIANRGGAVLWCSFEDSDLSATIRVLSRLSGIPNEQLQSLVVADDEWPRLQSASGVLSRVKMRFMTRVPRSVDDLAGQVRRWINDNGGQLALFDYFQLIRLGGSIRSWGVTDEEDKKLRVLVDLAKELTGCASLVVSQYHRRDEMTPPCNADLKKTGSLEQEGYTIMHLWDPPLNADPPISCKALIVGKQKQGRSGQVILGWNGDRQEFSEPDEYQARSYASLLSALSRSARRKREAK